MNNVPAIYNILAIILVLWTIPWKVYAVWLAVKSDRKAWFVVLVLINSLSILEMIYVFNVEKKSWEEVKASFRKGWETMRQTKKADFQSK